MKSNNRVIDELCNVLEIIFENKEYLITAITHSSYANQKKDISYNERFEFLGDSVLQLTITEFLFANYKNKAEGELTKIRALIVCENSLHEVARKWNLGHYIYMSKGEELTGGRDRVSIQADCVEAIIAAVYLDKGFNIARDFILKNFQGIIEKAIKNEIILDYKTKLQEKLQKNGDVSIQYDLEKYEGPPHHRKFYMKVVINDICMGKGVGYSKKEAEQIAAKNALIRMEDKVE